MLKLFLYREITEQGYRALTREQERTKVFGLDRIPDESVLSRTWRKRFNEGVQEFITTAAHYLVKEIHDRTLDIPEARPKREFSPQVKTITRFLMVPQMVMISPMIKSIARLVSLTITASMRLTPNEPKMLPTKIPDFSSYRRSWRWSVVEQPKGQLASSIVEEATTAHTVIPISGLSSDSILGAYSMDSTEPSVAKAADYESTFSFS